MAEKNIVEGLQLYEDGKIKQHCLGCAAGKLAKSPFPSKSKTDYPHPLSLVHTDLAGPIKPASQGGREYILTFLNEKTKMSWVYLLKKKSEVPAVLKQWREMAELQSGKSLKCLRSDNGGEYLSQELTEFFLSLGIIHQTTVPGNPQQNGAAERLNRTLMDMARSMVHGAGLPKRFWGEAIMAANYVRVRCSTSTTEQSRTPLELWSSRKPSIHHLRVFGCKVSVKVPEEQRSKMDPKCWNGVFVGYSDTQKGYRVWIESREQLITSRDLIFF